MFSRLLLIPLLLILAACQSSPVERDFDANRDFSHYRSWSWQEPAVQYRPDDPRISSDLTDQRLRTAIAQQLDQHGLRPAQPGRQTRRRVDRGWITSSMKPFSAATKGLAKRSS